MRPRVTHDRPANRPPGGPVCCSCVQRRLVTCVLGSYSDTHGSPRLLLLLRSTRTATPRPPQLRALPGARGRRPALSLARRARLVRAVQRPAVLLRRTPPASPQTPVHSSMSRHASRLVVTGNGRVRTTTSLCTHTVENNHGRCLGSCFTVLLHVVLVLRFSFVYYYTKAPTMFLSLIRVYWWLAWFYEVCSIYALAPRHQEVYSSLSLSDQITNVGNHG